MGAEFLFSRSFPLISERCLHSVRGRLFAEAWYGGGLQTRPYMPVARLGGCWPGAGFCFAGITGHFRALGSRLCGSGGWVRNFLVFRSFPLISVHFRALAPFRPAAGCSLGPGLGTGSKPAPTCRWHGWVTVGLAPDFVFCGHNRTSPGAGVVPAMGQAGNSFSGRLGQWCTKRLFHYILFRLQRRRERGQGIAVTLPGRMQSDASD